MADIELVIKIPEEEYEYLKAHHSHEIFYGDAIANGTPLPKHHGRLVSVDDVDDAIYDFSRGVCVDYGQIMEYIEHVPTIIPATKEGE